MSASAIRDEALEVQYNNQRRVPEFPRIAEDWMRRSAALREAARCDLDVSCGPGPRDRLDLYHAEGSAPPLLVYVHGGYWQRGDKSMYGFIARGPLARGFSVAVINYDLCPQVALGQIPPQVARTLAWLLRPDADGPCRHDAQRVFLAGHSAGGHLTAAMLTTDFSRLDATLPPCPLAGAMAISGVFELAPLVPTSINDALGLDRTTAERDSPAWRTPVPGACPLVAAVGGDESEEFLRQSRDLAARWAGATSTRVLVPARRNHFTVLECLADPDGELCAALGELARSTAA